MVSLRCKYIFGRGYLEGGRVEKGVLAQDLILDEILSLAADQVLDVRILEQARGGADLLGLGFFVQKGSEALYY